MKELLKFIGAGGFNTLFTLLLYQMLLFVMGEHLAYSISWLVGLMIVVIIYPSKVFAINGVKYIGRTMLAGSYLLTFLLGLSLIELLSFFSVQERLVIFIVIPITTLINFLLSKVILIKSKGAGW